MNNASLTGRPVYSGAPVRPTNLLNRVSPTPGTATPAATKSTATVSNIPAFNSSKPAGYSNLPTGFNWVKSAAPTTGDAVFTGTYQGKTVYVGPDNQPYLNGAKTTWAALGVKNANNNVTESTYNGPGADSSSTNDSNYFSNVPAGETITVGQNSVSNLMPGVYDSAGNIKLTGSTTPKPPTNSTTGSGTPGTTTTGTSTTPPTDTSPGGAISSLLGGGTGDSSGFDNQPGSVAGLQAIQPQQGSTSSTGSPMFLIIGLLVVGVVGFVIWKHHKSKGEHKQ